MILLLRLIHHFSKVILVLSLEEEKQMQRYNWSADDYLLNIVELEDEIEEAEQGEELYQMLIRLSDLKDELAELEA